MNKKHVPSTPVWTLEGGIEVLKPLDFPTNLK